MTYLPTLAFISFNRPSGKINLLPKEGESIPAIRNPLTCSGGKVTGTFITPTVAPSSLSMRQRVFPLLAEAFTNWTL